MRFNDSLEPEGGDLVAESQMWQTAQLLVDIAVKSHMKIYDVDEATARDWVLRAAEDLH